METDNCKELPLLRIFFVEDNEHDRAAFRRAFEKAQLSYHCDISEFERAEDALEQLSFDPPQFDILVVDYLLPGMTGLELCEALMKKGVPMPMVILTESGSEHIVVEAFKAGIYNYIVKDPDQGYLNLLPIVVKEVVKKHRDRLAREQTEKALLNEKFLIEGFMNSLPGLFYVFNEERFVKWNKEWETVTGYSADEISQMYGPDFFEGSDKTHIADRMRKVFVDGISDAEAEIVTKQGKRIPYYFTGIRKEFSGKPHLVGLGMDITERKLMENALLENQVRLDMAQEVSDVGSWDWKIKEDLLIWSDKAYRQFGLKPGEIEPTFQAFEGFVHPDDRELVKRRVEQALKDEKPYSVDIRMIRKDGSEWNMHMQGVVQRDKNSEPVRFVGTQHNITELKLAESLLLEVQEKLEKRVKERTKKLSLANKRLEKEIDQRKQAEEVLKFSQRSLAISNTYSQMAPMLEAFVKEFEAFIGCDSVGIRVLDEADNIPYEAYSGFSNSFYELESPLSIKTDQCMCINVIKGDFDPDLPFYTEGGSFYMNGTTKFLATVSEEDKGSTRNTCNQVGYESVALIPIRMGDKYLGLVHLADHKENMVPLQKVQAVEHVAWYLAIAMSRVVSDDKVKASEEKFRSMMETMTDAVYICSSDFRVEYMNPAMIKRTGFNTIGEFCYKTINGLDEKCSWCLHSTVQRGKRAVSEILSPMDNRFYSVSHSPISNANGSISKMTILRDVTEEKLLHEQLIRSERFAAVGQLAATVAHEINSPLQAITFLLSSLKDQIVKEEIQEDVLLLVDAFENIRDTVKHLLDLNRSGQEKKRKTNINEIIEKTVSLLQSYLKNSKVCVNMELSSKIPMINVSPQQIYHVFLNMINNSIEAICEQKQPSGNWGNNTSRREINIKTNLRKKDIIIQVSDTGPGISPEDINHIFDPFFTRKKKMGIGVGLSVCSAIVEEHGGTIKAENTPESGAVFTIILPVEQQK